MNQALNIAVLNTLVEKGHLSSEQRQAIAPESSNETGPLLKSIIASGAVSEVVFAQVVSDIFQIPLVQKEDLPTEQFKGTQHLDTFLIKHEVLPINFTEGRLRIALTDPSDEFVIKVLSSKLNCDLEPTTGERSEILSTLNVLYGPQSATVPIQSDIPDDLQSESELVIELHRLIQRAVSNNASDIHFEPAQGALKVRFRINGLLQDTHRFLAADRAQITARLKLMSGLDVSERRRPQDGRFKFPADGKVVDLRVSTLPLNEGESIVLRLLQAELSNSSLEDLGFASDLSKKLLNQIEQQQGLMLVTGPTGSGKTTTLYSLMNYLNKPELKIISIEDPVELSIAGINQIQIDNQHGMSFAESLKSVLRQDPDVIMVGEIRDPETAQLAAQAALTGHMVLSTLHTPSAAAAVTRLQNLGLPDYLISATLKGVLAQRLLRCVCESCAASNTKNNNCGQCEGTGYQGRSSCAEYLPMEELGDIALNSSNLEDLLNRNLMGKITLVDDARNKVEQGISSEQELLRVLGVSANL